VRILIYILILGQIAMATQISKININNTEVPLIYELDRSLPIVSLQIVFRVSGSIEDNGSAGLAKLSASMLSEGSKKRGSEGFANALESRAIHLSAHAGVETLVIEVDSLKEEFSYALELLKELLQEPNLTPDSFTKVQTTTVGLLTRKLNDYDYVAKSNLRSLLFKDTPLATQTSGTIQSIQSLKLSDVKEFLSKHLGISSAFIVVGGDIELDRLKKELQTTLSVLPKLPPKVLPYFSVTADEGNTTLVRKSEQAYLYFGSPYHIKVDDPEWYKSRVAMFILGSSGFGSRLMEQIRVKRGLAYSAFSRAVVSNSSSYFYGYLQTKNESLDEALSVVVQTISDFVRDGVTQSELDQAKKFILGSEPLRVETLSQRLSRTQDEYYRGRKLGDSRTELELIRSLTLDELNAFIKKHTEINSLAFSILKGEV